MVENPDFKPQPESSSPSNSQPESLPLNSILLEDAWRIYNRYDISAVKVQKRFIFLRLLILRLSILVTFWFYQKYYAR